jgi:hypothetical protein
MAAPLSRSTTTPIPSPSSWRRPGVGRPGRARPVRLVTRIAARYVPAGQSDAFGRRNAVAGELLVRLHPQRLVGEDDVAGPGRRE